MMIVIHRAEALPAMLAALQRRDRRGDGAAGAHQGRRSRPSGCWCARSRRSRAPLSIAPGLVLRDEAGFTAAVERINRGEVGIVW